MTIIREFVSKMSDDSLRQCVADYDSFERDGSIGECLLRKLVEELQNEVFVNMASFVMICEPFMKEIYRHYAMKYLELENDN